ncbi:flavin-containing monooxygenase [Rhodococcus sp. NPDC059968]|uniref:flavin-containing monooxygenase n=1 Tax=Rhodococcus sp. NPDC059968 TaxID=3347017 RepID=UPI003670080D
MNDVATPRVAPARIEVDAVVVGAGFAGIYAIHKLRNDLGLEVQAFDNASGVGGTWFWNLYPGARSDTEITAYCYSFDRELFETWEWTERYPKQPEILAYLNHVADKYDLKRSIQFDTSVVSSTWNDSTSRWDIETDKGQLWSAQFLIEGVGLLSSTNIPDLPGQSSFTGEFHHSSRWPKDGVDLEGKRVGVIGTGSTGVQIITSIAPEVAELTVFQRTAQYTVPAHHRPIEPEFMDKINSDYEGYWKNDVLSSITAFGFAESEVPAMSVNEAERDAIFEAQWNSGGGFQFMFATFSDIGSSRDANDAATAFLRTKIKEIVNDPETAEKLTPKDLYAKRPLCDDGYYATFNRDNVALVDVKAHPILEITPTGIRTDEGEYELDVIIFATGFDAFTGNYLKIDQRGRSGVRLADKWSKRPRALLGLMTTEFPNWFMLFGPMSPFTNQPPAHEVQVNWIADAIRHLREAGGDTIEPTVEAEDAWMDSCDAIAAQTLFPQVDSWINGANIPGKPVAVMAYMGGMGGYMNELKRIVDNNYDGLSVTGAHALA